LLGPWHLDVFDGAIDRRRRWYRPQRRRRWQPEPLVDVFRSRAIRGVQAIWPPIVQADQREYGRRLVAARRRNGSLITVLRRRGATAIVIVDVFGDGLGEFEQARVRRLFEALTPAGAYGGRIRPWVAIQVGQWGAFSTSVIDRRWDEHSWQELDALGPAVDALADILAGDRDRERAA
jgi:hypothetical protein